MSNRRCEFDGCGREHESHGLCSGHAKQLRKGWKLRPLGVGRPLEERFWDKVQVAGESDCWEWSGAIEDNGYGKISRGGRGAGMVGAHKLSYELANGPLPAGVIVDHRCFNHGCVNPAHLRAVTQKQNQENRAGLPANNKSGVRGVYWSARHERWVAVVKHHGKTHHVGHFTNLQDAETAVIERRNQLHTHNDLDRIAA